MSRRTAQCRHWHLDTHMAAQSNVTITRAMATFRAPDVLPRRHSEHCRVSQPQGRGLMSSLSDMFVILALHAPQCQVQGTRGWKPSVSTPYRRCDTRGATQACLSSRGRSKVRIWKNCIGGSSVRRAHSTSCILCRRRQSGTSAKQSSMPEGVDCLACSLGRRTHLHLRHIG